MTRIVRICFCISFLLFLATGMLPAQGLKAFKLPNGLSVFVYEDSNAPDVYGMVAFKAGAKDDPSNLTGLAHYLEHVLFKGTPKIGSLDWAKEEPIYQQVIQKYDERSKETDPIKREAINKEINVLTIEAAKYGLTNEFAGLTEGMGGTNLNAFTSYDMTAYHNSFPPSEVNKWLELNSERLINPVFRAFQTELETVYEEYNRSKNNTGRQVSDFLLSTIFPNHPYSRPVLGTPEHLKNPQLSELIAFYNKWYVPQNMALILVGNINTKEVLPMIREKFGRLENKTAPIPIVYPEPEFKGRVEYTTKLGNSPQIMLAYKGVVGGAADEIALEVCTSILSNSSRTGLFDKLGIDGDVMGAAASNLIFKEQGRIVLNAVPYYDVNQRRFNSLKSVEKLLLKEVEKLQAGSFDEALVESIKNKMLRDYDLMMESSESKGQYIMSGFVNGQDVGDLLNYQERVAALTVAQIKEVAKKYFTNDYMALYINPGKFAKTDKLKKPAYEPLMPPQNVRSDYAKAFDAILAKSVEPLFTNFDEVQTKALNDKSKLFYTKNNENEIFTLILRYGIGSDKMPNLPYSTFLMNNAGIMNQMEAQKVKQELSDLGASWSYRVDGSYLTVVMEGIEANLEASCNLLTRQILFPDLDEKQLDNLKGMEFQDRFFEQKQTENISSALNEYMVYGNKSQYIERPTLESVLDVSIGTLTGDFQRATAYEAEIHYAGSLDFETVYDLLNKNLPLQAGEKTSTSPEIRDRVKYTENTVYFVPDREAQQSNIYFYIEGDVNTKESDVVRSAFNLYFSGGFNGLVMKEIREYRSMAYTATGQKVAPPVTGKNDYFVGYVGTQADKVSDALKVYTGLVNDMPLHPERLTNIKNYLRESSLTSKPDFRSLSQQIEYWKKRGYLADPAKERLAKIESLTFDDIVAYYNTQIKGRPLAIAIVGDPKDIDVVELAKYGKVVKLPLEKLFSTK